MAVVRSSTVIGLLGLVVLTGSGCAPVRGTAIAGSPPPVSTTGTTGSPTTTVDDFGDLNACELLDDALAGKGFDRSKAETNGEPNGCGSEKAGYAGVNFYLQVGAPYDQLDVEQDKLFPDQVNGRQAIQIHYGEERNNSCAVVMQVGPSARAIAGATMYTESTSEACGFAKSVAEEVEPSLPGAAAWCRNDLRIL